MIYNTYIIARIIRIVPFELFVNKSYLWEAVLADCKKDCRTLNEYKDKLAEANTKLDILLDNIPGGVLSYDAESGKFDFIGAGCLSIFHCTEEQFREHFYNSFDLMVMKADRAKVKEMISNQIQFFDTVELTYRVKDFMDNVMWIYHKGRLVKKKDGSAKFYIVISDVTEEKLVQGQLQKINEQLYIETERYKLIEEAVDNIQYDYDTIDDILTSSEKDVQGNRRVIRDCIKDEVIKNAIHPDDYPTFFSMWDEAVHAPAKGVVEYRARYETGDYVWYRLNYASFADKNDRIIRMVGSAKEITKEKEEQEQLKARVELDGMTGLLNKVATQVAIEKYITNCDIGICHALLMIDTDNFKSVNDTLGHMYGDKVIRFVAAAIKETFRESDYVGRIGGDEFLVFMKHTTPSITEERAGVLNRAIEHTFTQDGQSVSVSCSIGIAYYGRDGEDFNTLFKHADDALYDAKESGKNQFRVYRHKD